MKFSASDLNRGIVGFLGFGVDEFPHAHQIRLVVELGNDRTKAIENEINSLLDEANRIPINWEEHSLASAGEAIIKEMAQRHPALSNEALRAITWKFTFDWR